MDFEISEKEIDELGIKKKDDSLGDDDVLADDVVAVDELLPEEEAEKEVDEEEGVFGPDKELEMYMFGEENY